MKFDGKHSNAFNFIYERYIFRFNLITGFYEVTPKKKKKGKKRVWVKYNDRYKNKILLELMENSIEVPTEKVNIFIESEKCSPDYNPFAKYFKKLPTWNPKKDEDYIKRLSKTVKTESQKEFYQALRTFLIGVVACILNEDDVNDVCLVFQSEQGVGKSRWMRKVLPKPFQSEYFYEGAIDTRNKDHNLYLSQYWFIHLDELESYTGRQIGPIKAYITRQRVAERVAYGRYKGVYIRRTSFLGSVNDDKFLTDTTGNRRWLVFKVNEINYQHNINPDLFWSQAYALYKSGERGWFDTEDIKKINKRNERFRYITMEEELLCRFFKFPKKKKKGEYLSSTEIIRKIIEKEPNFNTKLTAQKMGKSLAKHSKDSYMKSGVNRYLVDFKPPKYWKIKSKDDDYNPF